MKTKREGIALPELARQLTDGRLASIYMLVGEESFLREEAVSAIRRAVLNADADNGFNHDLLYGDDTDAIEIMNVCSLLPAFAERRIVIVRDVGALKARETERLLPYLQAPVDTTCLVLMGEKIDGRIRFFQTLKTVAVTVDCSPLDARSVSEWLHAQAKKAGLQLDDAACEALQHASGGGLAIMARELEKLTAYLFPQTHAGLADVEAVRGSDAGGTVWDLLEALGRKDRGNALRALGKVLDAGEPPLRLMGLLTSHWRQIWKTREQLARRVPEIGMARVLGVPPFRVRGLVEHARRFSDEDMGRAFEAFREADVRLKSAGRAAERLVMERLILNLCREARRTSATWPRVFVPAP